MNDKKIRQSILPIIAGMLVNYFLLYFYYKLMDIIYSPEDGDQAVSATFFYFPIFLISFIPIFLTTGLFQFFVTIPIWERYKRGKTILKLKLGQLIFFSSVIFGVSVAVLMRNTFTSTKSFIINIFSAVIMTLAYWVANYQTLKLLDRKKTSPNKAFGKSGADD